MAHDIFISYSVKDQKIVEGLSAYLEQNEIRCWIAYRDIPVGKDWAEYIPPAIKECKLMIYVHSSTSNVSTEINKEIALCLKKQHPIIPFRIQNIDYSDAKAYHLTTINHIDAFPNPEKYFGKLLTKIQNLFPELITKITKLDIDNKINKNDVGLMKILSKIGLFTIPLGVGLLGSLYGVFHSIIGLKKKIKDTQMISSIGLTFFVLFSFIGIITFFNNEWETFFALCLLCFPFGIIYSVFWIKKLNAIAKEQGDNIKELQKQSFVKHKRTLIIAIISLSLLFCVLLRIGFLIGYESIDEYDKDVEDVEIVESTNVDNYSVLQKEEWREDMARIMKNVNPYDSQEYSGQLYKGEPRSTYTKGLGVLLYANGDSYWGEWNQYHFDGIGLYITDESKNVTHCPDCKFFVGNYVASKKTGEGTCYNESGEIIYYGEFQDNMPVGTYPQIYEDHPYKFESIAYSEGNEKYVGETKDGNPHGQGIYIWKQTGNAWYGTWENGQWVENGRGVFLLYDGTVKASYE
jgi:hypothetical protein